MSIRFVPHDPRTFPAKSRVSRAREPRVLSNEMFFRCDVSNESEFRHEPTFPAGIIPGQYRNG